MLVYLKVYDRLFCGCVECECAVVVYPSVMISFIFDDEDVSGWVGSRFVESFGGRCRRWLNVVLVEYEYVTPGVLVRSVGEEL